MLTLLIVSLALNLYQALISTPHKDWYPAEDRMYIQKAAEIWSSKSGESLVDIERHRHVKIMQFGKDICVNLALPAGSLGGEPTYCFERTSGRVTYQFDDVE